MLKNVSNQTIDWTPLYTLYNKLFYLKLQKSFEKEIKIINGIHGTLMSM